MIGQKGIPPAYAGVERHVEELSLRLVERGHSVTVYSRPRYTPWGSRQYKGIDLVSFRSLPTKHLDAISHTAVRPSDPVETRQLRELWRSRSVNDWGVR